MDLWRWQHGAHAYMNHGDVNTHGEGVVNQVIRENLCIHATPQLAAPFPKPFAWCEDLNKLDGGSGFLEVLAAVSRDEYQAAPQLVDRIASGAE